MKELIEYPEYKKDTSYTVPDGVEKADLRVYIGVRGEQCALQSVTIPKSVKELYIGGLDGELPVITYMGNEYEFDEIKTDGYSEFSYNFLGEKLTADDYAYSLNADGSVKLLRYLGTNANNVAVPSSVAGKKVTSVSSNLFKNLKTVQSVILPDTITVIPEIFSAIAVI